MLACLDCKPLLRGHDHLLPVPVRALPLLSPLLSGHQEPDTLSLASFQEFDERKYCSGLSLRF